MTIPGLRIVGKPPLSAPDPSALFFLVVADHDRGFFCIEGPMADAQPWKDAALHARNHQRRIVCGPAGPDRNALAADYRLAQKQAGVPPGSILRIRQ